MYVCIIYGGNCPGGNVLPKTGGGIVLGDCPGGIVLHPTRLAHTYTAEARLFLLLISFVHCASSDIII